MEACRLAQLAVLAVLAAGCSVNPPEFRTTSARLVVFATDGSGGRAERLSFFASVSDADGVADIDGLFLVHDESELCWSMSPDDWTLEEDGSTVWIGSNGLSVPSGRAMPRGAYRAVLVDKAGERDERSFSLSAPETSAYDLPTVSLAGTRVSVSSPYPTNTAFFLDSGDNVVRTVKIASKTMELDSLWGDSGWRSGADYLAVYGLDPKALTGFFSWKTRLPD